MPRALTTARAAVLLVAITLGAALGAAPAQGQSDDSPSTTSTLVVRDGDSPMNDIVPQPNSGTAPDSPNDPGGWQQYLVMALIVGGLIAIFLLARRQSVRARATDQR